MSLKEVHMIGTVETSSDISRFIILPTIGLLCAVGQDRALKIWSMVYFCITYIKFKKKPHVMFIVTGSSKTWPQFILDRCCEKYNHILTIKLSKKICDLI